MTVRKWLAAEPEISGTPELGVASLARHVAAGEELLAALPAKAHRSPHEQSIADTIHRSCRNVRGRFMKAHASWVHQEIFTESPDHRSLVDIAIIAAKRFPGLVPDAEHMSHEREQLQADKEGREIDQGIFFWGLLRERRAGLQLIENLLRPTARAQHLLAAFRRDGQLNLGAVQIERRGGAAHLTVCNEHCLNAEDDDLIEDMETAVDLALLDDEVRVCVLRGGPVRHPRYAGRRVFSAGINLKHLHRGKISFLNFLLRRELGYLNKILKGLSVGGDFASWSGQNVQKPWLAAVDTFAIGGGAQLLLVFDRVIAASDCFFSLPAAQEGIVPGVANLRLERMTGGRMARQIILGGRKVAASEPDAALLFDDVVDPGSMDAAVEAGVAALSSPAVMANRRMLTGFEEPAEIFRDYMAQFSLEQAARLYSPDVLGKVSAFTKG